MKKTLGVLLVLCLLVLGSLSGCAAPKFEIDSLEVIPQKQVAGESISVEAMVSNTGSADGIYTATLTLDGVTIESIDIEVAAQSLEKVSFKWLIGSPGEHILELGNATMQITVLEPARFEVSSLDVSPEACLAGDAVVVSATLTNTGNAEGEYVVELLVNGVTEQSETIALDPKSSQPLSFVLTKSEPGRYDVQLGELTTSFVVLGAGNLEISPSEVEVGQPVTVSADLHNVAETETTYHSSLLWQGKEVEGKDVTVAGSSRKRVTFTLAPTASGIYEVELLGLSSSLKVLKPAEFKIVNLDIAPNPAKVGEQVTITATIKNVGEATGTYDARLLVNGAVLQTTRVTLAGGATKTISSMISKDSPGSYSVKIGGQKAILEMIQTVRLKTGTFLVREMSGGEAKLKIENARDSDAVVVLSSIEEPTIPLLAFYVRAGDSYRAGGILRGTYVIHVTQGRDWIEDSHKFFTEATYQRFSDEFDFISRSSRYTIWTISLGGGEGGEPAGTQRVGADEFPNLG